ncbi:hypothetical protein DPMN_097634 [Dreissena polymorpha]|uniref:Uncharacterized protein n=1 Tax=Dreissena polymorpha TaxID=45954 RepID=A0A9D4R4X2_DREPO|nr:hypothetical protein DPMN_097634 [Dreissena polymorpha]
MGEGKRLWRKRCGGMSVEETSWGMGGNVWNSCLGQKKINVPLEEIIEGKYSLVYAHPEAFLSTTIGIAILSAIERDKTVSCTAVDEAYMILAW